MKKIISKGIILFMLLILLISFTGCTEENKYNDNPVSVNEQSKKNTPIELYIKQNIKLGLYEPEEGVYLGAYVEKNKNIEGDITTFEKIVGQRQTFKVFQYTMGEGLSSQEILKCMAQRKVPYIKLLLGNDFDLTSLYRMISDINASYSVPIFIELFPLTSKISQPIVYKETFQRAHEIIHKYLDDAVIVWSVDSSRLYDMPLYYPGEELVDWVGINIYIPRYKDKLPYESTYIEDIDFWYKNFQKSKPMMISGLAISHFSTIDHTYTLNDAQNKLHVIYNKVLSLYPRIKSVLYIDVDMGEVVKNGADDYRITSQKQLTEYMKQAFKNDIFLDEIEEIHAKRQSSLYIKYDIVAAQFDEDLYLSKQYMSTFFKKVPLSKIGMIEDLNGEKFYKLDDVKAYNDFYYNR
ncbi:glycosyl hydrolase [Cellulosilyticum sp. I15G10I2]|uniref:glycosyl hydrolase n=1 Tax=Cellulosilyticum sp. I15G10I2 TaxID=1892843 RepID=UPI00085C951B|nr:glycosyl hydrolase [Cellulosilyticum sp. I15G10I2]